MIRFYILDSIENDLNLISFENSDLIYIYIYIEYFIIYSACRLESKSVVRLENLNNYNLDEKLFNL